MIIYYSFILDGYNQAKFDRGRGIPETPIDLYSADLNGYTKKTQTV